VLYGIKKLVNGMMFVRMEEESLCHADNIMPKGTIVETLK